MKIFIISAFLFGLPHFFVMSSGLLGVFIAGLLGLVLAKSVIKPMDCFGLG